MSWWAWLLIAVGGVVAVGIAYVVMLAALFSKGDNPESGWRR